MFFDFILENKEWLFSGGGVALLGFFSTILFRTSRNDRQVAKVKESSGPITIIQSSDQSRVNFVQNERTPANIHVVDVTVVETDDCPQVVDVKFRNSGDEVAFVKRVEFVTLGHWNIMSDKHPSLREVSAEYDIVIERVTNSVSSINISHEVKPQETDRIQIKLTTELSADPLGLSIFLLAGHIYFNEDDARVSMPLILTDICPPHEVLGSYFSGYAEGTIAKNKRVAAELLEMQTSDLVIQDGTVKALKSWCDAPDE